MEDQLTNPLEPEDIEPEDEELEEELDLDDEPEGPTVLYDGVDVDQTRYAAVIHDSFGERYANVARMAESGAAVTVLRVLGAMQLEPRGEVQIHINGNRGSLEHVVRPGDQIYIVGKLAGGR